MMRPLLHGHKFLQFLAKWSLNTITSRWLTKQTIHSHLHRLAKKLLTEIEYVKRNRSSRGEQIIKFFHMCIYNILQSTII